MEGMTVELRVRLSAADVHYGGNLVDGAHGLELFGDVVTELAIRTDGDEGLFAGYESVEFLAPLFGGDSSGAGGRSCAWGTRAAPSTSRLEGHHRAPRCQPLGRRHARGAGARDAGPRHVRREEGPSPRPGRPRRLTAWTTCTT